MLQTQLPSRPTTGNYTKNYWCVCGWANYTMHYVNSNWPAEEWNLWSHLQSFWLTQPGIFWWELVEIIQDGKFNNMPLTSPSPSSPGESNPWCVNLVPSFPLPDERAQGRRSWSSCIKKVVFLYQGRSHGLVKETPWVQGRGNIAQWLGTWSLIQTN